MMYLERCVVGMVLTVQTVEAAMYESDSLLG